MKISILAAWRSRLKIALLISWHSYFKRYHFNQSYRHHGRHTHSSDPNVIFHAAMYHHHCKKLAALDVGVENDY